MRNKTLYVKIVTANSARLPNEIFKPTSAGQMQCVAFSRTHLWCEPITLARRHESYTHSHTHTHMHADRCSCMQSTGVAPIICARMPTKRTHNELTCCTKPIIDRLHNGRRWLVRCGARDDYLRPHSHSHEYPYIQHGNNFESCICAHYNPAYNFIIFISFCPIFCTHHQPRGSLFRGQHTWRHTKGSMHKCALV